MPHHIAVHSDNAVYAEMDIISFNYVIAFSPMKLLVLCTTVSRLQLYREKQCLYKSNSYLHDLCYQAEKFTSCGSI